MIHKITCKKCGFVAWGNRRARAKWEKRNSDRLTVDEMRQHLNHCLSVKLRVSRG